MHLLSKLIYLDANVANGKISLACSLCVLKCYFEIGSYSFPQLNGFTFSYAVHLIATHCCETTVFNHFYSAMVAR